MQQSPSDRLTFRIRGVPLDWNKSRLRICLEQHDASSYPSIKSFALEVDRCTYSATVVFKNLPLLTQGPKPWRIPQDEPPKTQPPSSNHPSIDNDFLGITTLYAPPSIVALGDISGHPLESYEEVASKHLWLRDILPSQLVDEESHQPMARVMTYGYRPILERNDGPVTFQDLGKALLKSLSTLGNSSKTKPIILIGHGIGGLIVKQTNMSLFRAIHGVVFFGVPHDGMDTASLQRVSRDGPNQWFVESLRQGGRELLRQIHSEFVQALDQNKEVEIFSFYETLESSISPKVKTKHPSATCRSVLICLRMQVLEQESL
ncbi:hypothetical protein Trco_003431 [Trichoderma cornu-damae]|uniref:DUF676 domain-containing protein n=1 Tax=Trichoderma cornu-damae TaxID=654480 RepID=A0A9P8TW60_9HYPO|nr:hypothetical protein Trco_003431 [Trichoderma cornu-damae]